MNFLDYALHHLSCILRVLRGDTAALGDMDISADGFWRSFEAFPAALPALFFAWVVEARQLQAHGVYGSITSMIVRMAMLEIVFWIVPVLVLAFVLRALRMTRRFTHLIIARNWLSALVSYLFVVVPLSELAAGGGQENALSGWLTLAAIGLMLWFSVRITRIALNVQVMTAIGFVAVETTLTYPLAFFAYGAVGLYPAV